MNGLFGLELPTSVNFVIAFVVVLALIGAATWLVRRFGAPRLDAGARNRQPRLAVIDSAAVDGRRKLVIIRRDNVEHLLMVGGPTDVVVETNIVRSGAAVSREAPAVRVNGEMLPRAMPLSDTTHWPLQPEPRLPRRRVRAGARRRTRAAARPHPHSCPPPARAVRVQRDAPTSVAADQSQPAAPVRAVQQAPARAPAPKIAPVVQIDPHAAAANDQNLANIAHQLEAALRRPVAAPADAPKPIEQKRIEPVLRPVPKAAAAAAAPVVAPQKQPVHSIEQEMASRLGVPGKADEHLARCLRPSRDGGGDSTSRSSSQKTSASTSAKAAA